MIRQFNPYNRVTAREVNYLGLDDNRLHLNGNVIDDFIKKINAAYIDFYGRLAWH